MKPPLQHWSAIPVSKSPNVLPPAALLLPTAALLLVAACSSGGTASATNNSTPAGNGSSQAGGRPGGTPGVGGLVAAIDGSTLQVQANNAQTAVTYTAATKFTATVPATAADVKAGVCVTVRPPGTPGASTQPSPPSGTATTVTAGAVTVSEPVSGKCQGAGGRPGGVRPGGTRPSTPPSSRPSGGNRRGGSGGFGAFGTVKSVTSGGFTVEQAAFGSASASPTTITVTATGSTSYTRTAAAAASAVAVGKCVTAIGKADDTGTVQATAIAVRPAENGACAVGFGGPRGGQNGPGNGGN
jgi:hypothetical protein